MAFPNELSVARLRGLWLKANGDPSPAILTIAAKYYTGVGDALITTAPFEVRLQDGRLDVDVPIGDDPDLSSPLFLDITARVNGTNKPEKWTVQVTAEDIVEITENGRQVKVVNLNKLIVVDGRPLINLGLVRSVDGIKPDARGNVDLPDFLSLATLDQRLAAYAKTTALADLATKASLAEYAKTTALAALVRRTELTQLVQAVVADMFVAGPGISISFDPLTGRLMVSNTGGGSTNPDPDAAVPGALIAAFTPVL